MPEEEKTSESKTEEKDSIVPAGMAPWKQELGKVLWKVVTTGAVTGGGVMAVLNGTKLPEIAMGMLGGGLFTGGGAIATSLIGPTLKKTKKGAEFAGEKGAEFVENQAKELVDKVLGVDDRYLELQKEDCQASLCDGIAQVFTPLLEEIFVPLSMTFTDRRPGWMNDRAEELGDSEALAVLMPSSQKEAQIWKWLQQAEKEQGVPFRRMAILAFGGYGKTTLLKHIAYIYSSKQHRRYDVSAKVPIFLPLKTYGKIVTGTPTLTLPEVVMQYHVLHLSRELMLPENWAASKLKAGEVVLLLDGLDEVKEGIRPQVTQWLKRELREYPKSIAILTSRPKAYDDQPIATKLEMRMRIWVEPFNPAQQESFIQRWYGYQELYANNGRSTSDVTRRAKEKAVKLWHWK